jgi:hypothetical protein
MLFGLLLGAFIAFALSLPTWTPAFAGIGKVSANSGLVGLQSSPPVISSARIEDKQLIVEGMNFEEGAKILVNGVHVKTQGGSDDPSKTLIVVKANKRLPRDEIVSLQVSNPDGQVSLPFNFFTGLTLNMQNTPEGPPVYVSAGRKFLLMFNDPNTIWQTFYPPSENRPVVKIVMGTQDLIPGSQELYLARHPGYAPFVMDMFRDDGNSSQHFVNLYVE